MTENDDNDILTADFFCGAGGLSKGFENEGFRPVFGLDIDPAQLQTYERNHEDVATIQGDIRKVDADDIQEALDEEHDGDVQLDDIQVVVGGPPCEGFSLAGDRDEEDPRNQLFRHYFNIVEEIDPQLVIMENVDGILSMDIDGTPASDLVINRLNDMGFNIDSHWKLTASDYGVPQNRTRVFFVGVKNQSVWPPEVETEEPVSVWEALSDLPSLDAGEEKEQYEDDPKTSYQEEMRANCHLDEDGEPILYNHKAYNHGSGTVARFELTPHGENYISIPDKDEFDSYVPSTEYNSRHNKLVPYEPAFTVTSHCNDEMVHYNDSRVLTVRECARLQSFPDDYVFTGPRSNGHGSDPENQYEQVGNAVPPKLAQSIAGHLRKIVFEGDEVRKQEKEKSSQNLGQWM